MMNLNCMMSPNHCMDRTMGITAIGAIAIGAVASLASTGVGMYQANQLKQDAKGMSNAAKAERAQQQAALNKQKDEYRSMNFENPFTDMENTFEDLTVNTQQAEFQAKQGSQQRANIMQSMKGAAGSSGIAGLAQAMANQGQLQTQKISASIGLQEASNQKAAAQGANAVQTAERQGDQWVQQANMDRQATLLGMQMGQTSGANMAFQQSQANQMNAQIAQNQALTDGISSLGSMATGLASLSTPTPTPSDRKLKKNINKIGESLGGLNIYSFEYKNSKYGEGLFQGVMSDEIPREAVSTKDGYDMVDYSALDVEFKQI